KFWPSARFAAMPCRPMTSRSGGSAGSPVATDSAGGDGRGRAPRAHRRGEPERGDEARLAGDALAGDVGGGAVIGRGADEGQAQRDIDAALEIDGLERDERLVVIHAQ